MLAKSELLQWLDHPITKRITSDLQQLKDVEISSLVSGGTYKDHAKTAYVIGFIAGLSKFLEYDVKELTNDRVGTDRP